VCRGKGLAIDVEMAAQIIRVGIHGLAGQLITTGRCYPWKDPERMKDEVIARLPGNWNNFFASMRTAYASF